MRQNLLKTVVVISAAVAACSPSGSGTDQATRSSEQIGLNCNITFTTTDGREGTDRITLTINIDTGTQEWWATNSVSHERNPRSALFEPGIHALRYYSADSAQYHLEMEEERTPNIAARIDRYTGVFTRAVGRRVWNGTCAPGEFTPPPERRF